MDGGGGKQKRFSRPKKKEFVCSTFVTLTYTCYVDGLGRLLCFFILCFSLLLLVLLFWRNCVHVCMYIYYIYMCVCVYRCAFVLPAVAGATAKPHFYRFELSLLLVIRIRYVFCARWLC